MFKFVLIIATVILIDMTFNVAVALLTLYAVYRVKYPGRNNIEIFVDSYIGIERVGKGNVFNPYREYYAYGIRFILDGIQYTNKYLSNKRYPAGFQQIITRHAKPKGNYIQILDSYEKNKYKRLAILIAIVAYAWAFIAIIGIAWFLLCCIK